MADKTFFDDVKETAGNNQVGIGAGVIGLMLGLFAFDLGPLTSLLIGAGAFFLGNAMGDGENSVWKKLFPGEQKKRDISAPGLDLEVGPPNASRTPSLSAAQLAELAKGPAINVEQSGQNVSFEYKGLNNGVLVTMKSEGMLNGDKLTLPGTKITVGEHESGLAPLILSVGVQPNGTVNPESLKTQLATIASEEAKKIPSSIKQSEPGIEAPMVPGKPAVRNK